MDSNVYNALAKTFSSPDPHSFGVFKMLGDIAPFIEEKLFHNNMLMQRLVMTNYNSMDIMDYPVCNRCEAIAAWSAPAKTKQGYVRACTCRACGTVSKNPVTLRGWLVDEIKHKAPPEKADELAMAVDRIAEHMLMIATRNYKKLLIPTVDDRRKQMGITVHKAGDKKPQHIITKENEVKKQNVLYLSQDQYKQRQAELDSLLDKSED